MGLYHYEPSQGLAVIAAGLFGLGALIHLFQMIRYKTWFFTAFLIGAMSMLSLSSPPPSSLSFPSANVIPVMTLGYAMRFLSARSPDSVMLYALQSLFIILPPSLYAATLYMIYGRLVLFINLPHASLIRPSLVTKIFVIGDLFSFFTQASAGGMMVQASMAKTGKTIMLLGLALQLIFFAFFLIVAVTFWLRVKKALRTAAAAPIPQVNSIPWPRLFIALFIAAGLIIIRCAFRVVEFQQDADGVLQGHEWYAYVFDAVPMLFVQTLFNIVHAGRVLPKHGGQEDRENLDEEYIKLNHV
ncbi:RTA1 like protein [Aureobasidium pullulans]|uniref:RTA1 like protein n=1 Tax=Aureobasidium pullulans TaxID=5580 RepID=A0A4S8Y2F3_AURPU|nr:RTA1 like protein [Aureobasidium pullulans]